MKKKYTISIDGCDDSTEALMHLNKKEFAVILKLSKLSHEISTYVCMPTLPLKDIKSKTIMSKPIACLTKN